MEMGDRGEDWGIEGWIEGGVLRMREGYACGTKEEFSWVAGAICMLHNPL